MLGTCFLLLGLSSLCCPQDPVYGGDARIMAWGNGTTDLAFLGFGVAAAGDVDGDGLPDFILGSPGENLGSQYDVGSVQLQLGSGSTLFKVTGPLARIELGASVAAIGDVNGDGRGDILAGAPAVTVASSNPIQGRAYVLSGLDGSILFEVVGASAGDLFGFAVAGLPDLDGDGVRDFLVGAPYADPGGLPNAGSVSLYSGATGLLIRRHDGAAADDLLGAAVAEVADLDGDGVLDYVVTATGADPFGLADAGIVDLYSSATGALIKEFTGDAPGDYFGFRVAGVGDVDRDGTDDLLIGAPGADVNGLADAGTAIVFMGAGLKELFRVNGQHENGQLGYSVAGAGDLNGDQAADLLIGAPDATIGGIWESGYVEAISGASGSESFYRISGGAAWTHTGSGAMACVGDFDGDGLPDAIIGDPGADQGSLQAAGGWMVVGFHPYLVADSYQFSASAGWTINLSLDFPGTSAGAEYKVLISRTGKGPMFYGVLIPLHYDQMVVNTFNGIYPFNFYSGLQGFLDANGDAIGSIALPPGAYVNMVGKVYTMAAIANFPGILPHISSIAVPVEVKP